MTIFAVMFQPHTFVAPSTYERQTEEEMPLNFFRVTFFRRTSQGKVNYFPVNFPCLGFSSPSRALS